MIKSIGQKSHDMTTGRGVPEYCQQEYGSTTFSVRSPRGAYESHARTRDVCNELFDAPRYPSVHNESSEVALRSRLTAISLSRHRLAAIQITLRPQGGDLP
jgi:hypothetical protein